MDRFLALRIFTKVVEAGSFVGAARALDLSPATVTSQMQALERRLKTRLLNRTTRRVALTDEGAAYYAHCSEILARMEEADAMLSARRLSPKGTLRVMMPPLLGTLLVMPEMPRFLALYPELCVEFTLSAQTPDFLAQNLDLCLQITQRPEPGVVFRPLGRCRVRTLASPYYLRRYGVPQTPEELDHHQVIGVRAVPGALLSTLRFERHGESFSRNVNSRLVADSGDAQRVAALAHGGVFQGYHYSVADLIKSGALVPLLQDWEWSGPMLGAAHPPNRFLPPKVRVFLEFVEPLLAPNLR